MSEDYRRRHYDGISSKLCDEPCRRKIRGWLKQPLWPDYEVHFLHDTEKNEHWPDLGFYVPGGKRPLEGLEIGQKLAWRDPDEPAPITDLSIKYCDWPYITVHIEKNKGDRIKSGDYQIKTHYCVVSNDFQRFCVIDQSWIIPDIKPENLVYLQIGGDNPNGRPEPFYELNLRHFYWFSFDSPWPLVKPEGGVRRVPWMLLGKPYHLWLKKYE